LPIAVTAAPRPADLRCPVGAQRSARVGEQPRSPGRLAGRRPHSGAAKPSLRRALVAGRRPGSPTAHRTAPGAVPGGRRRDSGQSASPMVARPASGRRTTGVARSRGGARRRTGTGRSGHRSDRFPRWLDHRPRRVQTGERRDARNVTPPHQDLRGVGVLPLPHPCRRVVHGQQRCPRHRHGLEPAESGPL
jgi:hypothetical protein